MALIQLDPWVHEFVESQERFNWLNCGRQLGKSTGLVIRRIGRGLLRRRLQILVSASQRQAGELAHKAQNMLQGCGLLNLRRDTASATHIQTPQLRMVFLPPNPATIRGFTGDVDRFRRHQRGHFLQRLAAQHLALHGQPSALVVVKQDALLPDLLSQDPVLFPQCM